MAGEALSNGTLVEVQTAPGPPIVYTAVGGIDGDFTAPGVLNEEIEVTGLDSTAREYIGGLSETGETSFQLMLRKEGTGPATANFQAGQEALKDLSVTRARVQYCRSRGGDHPLDGGAGLCRLILISQPSRRRMTLPAMWLMCRNGAGGSISVN